MKEKLVITGGSGLLALNWAMTVRDRFDISLFLHKKEVSLDGVHSHCVPLGSIHELTDYIHKIAPCAVIHTAGYTNVDNCELHPELAHYINVQLAENVSEVCRRLDILMVHISTDHIFSGDTQFVTEEHAVSPINVYAKTKALAERSILEINPNCLIIRTNFYGWGPSYRLSFSDIIYNSLVSNREIMLFDNSFYTPILVQELALTTHELIKKNAHGIFHVVGDERISKYQFGLKLAERFNLDCNLIKACNIEDKNMPAPRPKDMSISNKKVCSYLDKQMGGVMQHLTYLYNQKQHGYDKEIRAL